MVRHSRGRSTTRLLAIAGAVMLVVGLAAPAVAKTPRGFKTAALPMLTPVLVGATVDPIITVGERINGYRFEAIPDGIAIRRVGERRIEALINHETSRVAFPYVIAGPTVENSANDFDNAQLSSLILDPRSARVLDAEMVITSDERYQRFCSNFLATPEQGFSRPILFTNEEAVDYVYREGKGTDWVKPIPASDPNAEQSGVVVAYDPATGARKTIYGMGRLNHENSVAIPGFRERIILTGDDTFTTNPAQSQVYAYVAKDTDAVWNDTGTLYGFRAKDWRTYNDYYDFKPTDPTLAIEGELVPIDKATAQGDQTGLETASDAAGVFEFVRVEDIAYDRKHSNVVYIADSGRANVGVGTGVRYEGDSRVAETASFASKNGRIWKMVLDPRDLRHVLSLSVLIDGDTRPLASEAVPENPAASLGAIHQPDNLETTRNGIFVTEDPSSANQYAPTNADGTTARVWWYHLTGPKKGTMEVVFKVDQSADEGPTDRDPAPPLPAPGGLGNQGVWESSGIIDVSRYFGPGTFLIDVQAHSLWIEVDAVSAPDATAPEGPDWIYKREGGQLLLVRIPGA